MSVVQAWDVYCVSFNHRLKYFVALLQVKEEEYGFQQAYWVGCCINTGPQNTGIQSLYMCDIEVSFHTNHRLLDRNSYVNLGRMEKVAEWELNDCILVLDRGTQSRIKERVMSCPAVPGKYKARIAELQTRR